MRLAAALFLLLFAAAPASAADKPVPLTRESVATMPDGELTRRVFGELGHVMFPQRRPERQSAGRFRPLRGLDFLTRPRASGRAGVCETDMIVVAFEPVPFAPGDDPPVRPYRFEKYENHFIQDFAAARQGGPSEDEEAESRLDAVCRKIDPRSKRLIVASSAVEIVAGLDSLADLIEAAGKSRALAPLECEDESGEPVVEAACLVNLARLDPLELYYSTFVDGCSRKDPGVYCRSLKVHGPGGSMDIELEHKRGGREALRIRVKPSFDESSLYP
jgi:hypothetical protein